MSRDLALASREAMRQDARRPVAGHDLAPCMHSHIQVPALGSSEANSRAQRRVSTKARLLPLPQHNLARGDTVGCEARVRGPHELRGEERAGIWVWAGSPPLAMLTQQQGRQAGGHGVDAQQAGQQGLRLAVWLRDGRTEPAPNPAVWQAPQEASCPCVCVPVSGWPPERT